MQPYKTDGLIRLLDPATIKALNRIYGLGLKHLAARLNMTPPAVFYLLKNDRLQDWHKEKILALFLDYGADPTLILLIHTMTNTKRADHETD